MFPEEALLFLVGLSAGSVVAAGVYAFLAVIGVYPRLMGKTAAASKGKILLYETFIALGGLLGNVSDLFTEEIKEAGQRILSVGVRAEGGNVTAGNLIGGELTTRNLIAGNLIDRGLTGGTVWMQPAAAFMGQILLAITGLSCGIFVGCLVMSLAETLKALPVLSRRLRLSVGLQYLILAIAAGKCAGALCYFLYGIGRP